MIRTQSVDFGYPASSPQTLHAHSASLVSQRHALGFHFPDSVAVFGNRKFWGSFQTPVGINHGVSH